MPEFHSLPMKRSKWSVQPPTDTSSDIFFNISSEDGTAFRATINSLIQFANVVENSLGLVGDKSIKHDEVEN